MNKEVIKWRDALNTGEASWTEPINKLKFKYENAEWQQVTHEVDLFKDPLFEINKYCGDDPTCWLDVYNWSLMNKTTLTEDIYQFIVHKANVIREAIDREIANFNIDWEYIFEAINLIIGGLFI
jgi:hypothetical protein